MPGNAHTYYVSRLGVLVHNQCRGAHLQLIVILKVRDRFRSARVKPEEISVWTNSNCNCQRQASLWLRALSAVREDFISKVDRPVFSLRHNSSRMKSEWCFVVDRSSINIFLQGLEQSLTNINDGFARPVRPIPNEHS